MLILVFKVEVFLLIGIFLLLNGKKFLCFFFDCFFFWKYVFKLLLKLCNNVISVVSLFCVGYVFLNNNCCFLGLGVLLVVVKFVVVRCCLGELILMFVMY